MSTYPPLNRRSATGSASSAIASRFSVSLLLSQASSGRLITVCIGEDRYGITIGTRSTSADRCYLVWKVAADIVKTIAIELTFTSLGLLAGLVVVRTFLSWTLVLEIEGRWPWRRELAPVSHVRDPTNLE